MAYRMGHFYAQSNMLLIDTNETDVKKIAISNTLGRVVEHFDEVLKSAIMQPIKFEQYSDEVFLRFLSCVLFEF